MKVIYRDIASGKREILLEIVQPCVPIQGDSVEIQEVGYIVQSVIWIPEDQEVVVHLR